MEVDDKKTYVSHAEARNIMWYNHFFGIEDVIECLGMQPTENQIKALERIPFTRELLQACKDTHILIAVFSLSILEIGEMNKELILQPKDEWCKDEEFAMDKGLASWQLVRKDFVENSVDKTWNEEQLLLGEDDIVPSARVMVYTMIVYHLKNNKDKVLLYNVFGRCSCVTSNGDCVCVSTFMGKRYGNGLLCVTYESGDSPKSYIGLSSAKKQDNV
jgi:hypothetical protein